MPKSLFIDPVIVRKKGDLTFRPIPINHYQKTIEEEKMNFSSADFIRIFRDMQLIREFETMFNQIKVVGEYNGISYNHPGPAHFCIGQEAAAVGMAYYLTVDDYIFGSHRSHGEMLAKGFSAIYQLSEDDLMKIMTDYGSILRVVEQYNKGTVKELATDFLLYGTLAEIFGREIGFNKGLCGSMHAFFPPFGVYPNNAIVGGSADIAVGAALYKKVNKKPGIVIANIGDAAMGCGPVWEGICFSAMDQFKTLWQDPYNGGLPVMFNFMNNQYGMGSQACGETLGFGILARLGAGVNPDMMHAERVDGYNPLAVIDVYKRKKKIMEEKNGPVLLDTLTYRLTGHSASDASSYRTKEELDAWKEQDPLLSYATQLVQAGIAGEDQLEQIREWSKDTVFKILKLASDDNISPRLNLDSDPDAIAKVMFSNGSRDRMAEGTPEVLLSYDDNPRIQQIRKKERFGLDNNGNPLSKVKAYQVRDGLFEAILDRFYKDPTMVAYGEENRDWGGSFAVYRGLTEALPYNRLFNTPISEAAIVGTAIGYGMSGGRVLAEIMYSDFLGRCGDEVFNQLPKWQAMSANLLKMPVVIRLSVGMKYGAQHSQDWSAFVAHVPGLKVVFPVTPYDAKGLMNASLQGTDPVIFFESQRIYDIGEWFHEGGVPEGYYEIQIGEPDIKRKGEDLTILTVGPALYTALKASDILEEKYGLSAEVIDARSLVPFNYEPVIESLKKTGKILLATEATSRGSFLKEMAQTITELAFDELDVPPVVVGSKNWIVPAYEMEKYIFPQESWILDAIHEKIMPLKGYQVSNNYTYSEQIRRNQLGI